MEEMCKHCSQWNDYHGRCYAPYWCPDKKTESDTENNASEQSIIKKAELAMKKHKEATGEWNEGNIAEYWNDEEGNLCVRYESGNWWHYKDIDLPFSTWW